MMQMSEIFTSNDAQCGMCIGCYARQIDDGETTLHCWHSGKPTNERCPMFIQFQQETPQ